MKSMEKEGGTRRNMGIGLREEGEKAMIVNAVSWMARRGKLGVRIRYEKRMEDGDVQGLCGPDPFRFPGQGCSQETPPAVEMLHLPQCWS